MITELNKQKSLDRWRKILKDHPNITQDLRGEPDAKVYGSCAFCTQYRCTCSRCELYEKRTCDAFKAAHPKYLYWRIVDKLILHKPCKFLILRMIRAIENVEAAK